MKKLQSFITALVLGFTVLSQAQDIQVPGTPAFSILGWEPSAVMRPNSTKKLTSDLSSAFDSDGNLKANLGMEVMPYWLKSRPELTREAYLNPTTGLQTVLQTLSLSAAAVKDSVTGLDNLGVGLRFQLVKGKLPDAFYKPEAALLEMETAMAEILQIRAMAAADDLSTLQQAIDTLQAALDSNTGISKETTGEVMQKANEIRGSYDDGTIVGFCQALNAHFSSALDEVVAEGIRLSNKRTGFSLEVAAAGKFITTTGNQAFQKAGLWVNANNYFTDSDAWTITARFMTTTNDTISNNFDAGLGYIKEGKHFNVSVEGLLRWYSTEIPDFNLAGDPITRLEKDLTYRLAAQISYTITENVSLNMSVGKEFDDAHIAGKSFFSLFGLQYALFNNQKGLLQKKP